jgi:hypothetical protein
VTPNDLARFLRGILSYKLLSRVKTATWLKPAAFTSSTTGNAAGTPWAILRPGNVPRSSGARPLELYTMIGSVPFYGAYVALIPEYQVGIVVNIAGPGDDIALRALLDLAVQNVVPVLDDLARSQAKEKYVGSYGPASGGADGGSSLVLEVDNGPGLKVKQWKSGGKSVFDAWVALSGESEGASAVDVRIYPIGGAEDRWEVVFRGIPDKNETGIFETACNTWFNVDQFRYAGLSVDEVKFVVGEGGVVKGLEVPGLRQNLAKL